jgi:hypothetical protein
MKIGDEFTNLDKVSEIFAEHPDIKRIAAIRSNVDTGNYKITAMDDGPFPVHLRAYQKRYGYERNNKRGWESIHDYSIASDTMQYRFYRL